MFKIGLTKYLYNYIIRYREKNVNQFKKRVRKGIPDVFRAKTWMEISGANKYIQSDEYENLLLQHASGQPNNATCMGGDIEKDLLRTLPDLEMFQGKGTYGQHMLKRLLIAYAIKDKEVYKNNILDWILSRYELSSWFFFIIFIRNTSILFIICCYE